MTRKAPTLTDQNTVEQTELNKITRINNQDKLEIDDTITVTADPSGRAV